ncbi:hypothetical protein CALCODRAFT_502302 [Calocera cornea HHB12733]|uniref:Uncharacterized protein n=1 Tax=Calocera cornea HHB12733 TaxID=1353952 RepID=A0A165DBA5_9BASI|nr:hypothetical protein CALCODRAFT_502302 [Calocera cornea HHB12733]
MAAEITGAVIAGVALGLQSGVQVVTSYTPNSVATRVARTYIENQELEKQALESNVAPTTVTKLMEQHSRAMSHIRDSIEREKELYQTSEGSTFIQRVYVGIQSFYYNLVGDRVTQNTKKTLTCLTSQEKFCQAYDRQTQHQRPTALSSARTDLTHDRNNWLANHVAKRETGAMPNGEHTHSFTAAAIEMQEMGNPFKSAGSPSSETGEYHSGVPNEHPSKGLSKA